MTGEEKNIEWVGEETTEIGIMETKGNEICKN